MRLRYRLAKVLPLAVLAGTPLVGVSGQAEPPHGALTTSRILLVPAQGVGGAPAPAAWLARYDSVLTGRLHDGGVGSAWAYARDTERFWRQNPTYLSDPRTLGAQPLMGDKVKEGFVLPEPFGSRLRAYVALADARFALVPVAAVVDSVPVVRQARLRLAIVDGRLNRVLSVVDVSTAYQGAPQFAADSLAFVTARLFVK
jgi:hypothetical protein